MLIKKELNCKLFKNNLDKNSLSRFAVSPLNGWGHNNASQEVTKIMDVNISSYQWLLSKFGPLLTLEQTAKFLHKTPNAVRKSSNAPKNPLKKIKRKIGRKTYFSASDLADLADGRFSSE